MGYGDKIKELAKNNKMTIKELSEKSSVSLNTLYSITKRNSSSIENEIIYKLAPILGVGIYQFVEDNDRNPEFFHNFYLTYNLTILRLMGMAPREFLECCKNHNTFKSFEKHLGKDYIGLYIDKAKEDYLNLRNLIAEYDNDIKDDSLAEIIAYLDKLNIEGKRKAVENVKILTEVPKYQKEKDTLYSY